MMKRPHILCSIMIGPILTTALAQAENSGLSKLNDGMGKNILQNYGFEEFKESELSKGDSSWGNPGGVLESSTKAVPPIGWSVSSWNQAFVKERFGRGTPGRDGSGSCLEISPTTNASTIGVVEFTSDPYSIVEKQAYFFKGYYASTCDRVSIFGEWIDTEGKSLGKFEVRLPDTQDEWIHFTKNITSPDKAAQLVFTLEKKWQKGRVRFDDFSLRKGQLIDYVAEFDLPTADRTPSYPIFAWLGPGKWPRHGKEMEAFYNSDEVHLDYVLAGFNVGYSPRFGTQYFESIHEPDQAEKLDIAKMDKDSNFWAFHGIDEPGEQLFPHIAKMYELLRARGSTRPYWINLLPTYGFASYEDYEKYVRDFMRLVPTKTVTFDHYTLQKEGEKFVTRRDWFANLEIFRRLSLENNVSWGIIIQLGAWGGQPTPNENALRWQVFNSLVYGSKALGWFCYLTEIEYGGMNWRDHVLDREGFRSGNYTKVRRLNSRLNALGDTLLKLHSTGVFHSDPLPELTVGFGGSKLVSNINGGQFVFGEFLSEDGSTYFMVSNRDINEPATAKLTWRTIPKDIHEVCQTDGRLIEAEGFRSDAQVWSLKLAPGEGRLFKISPVSAG